MLRYKLLVYVRGRWRPVKLGPGIKVVGLHFFVGSSIFWGRTTLDIREATKAAQWANKRNLKMRLVKTFDGGIEWPIGKSGSLS